METATTTAASITFVTTRGIDKVTKVISKSHFQRLSGPERRLSTSVTQDSDKGGNSTIC
jgi:hypothetical protein